MPKSSSRRKRLIRSYRVIPAPPEDDEAWELLHYEALFAGSDYIGSERFLRYEKTLADRNVDIIFFEYTRVTSSSLIREMIGREGQR